MISADGHCRLMHMPFDLWTKRLAGKFQDDGPRVVQGPDGTRFYRRIRSWFSAIFGAIMQHVPLLLRCTREAPCEAP